MKNSLSKILTFALLAMFLASAVCFTVPAHAVTSSVDIVSAIDGTPNFNFNTTSNHVGDTFKMNITVTNADNVGTWQLGIQWNSSALGFVSMTIPSDNIFAGKSPISSPADNSTPGLVVMGSSVGPGQTAFSGSGRIAQLTLKITTAPGAGETIQFGISFEGLTVDTYLLDPSLTDLTNNYTWNNAHYKYVGPAGPPPSVHDIAITKIVPASNNVANDSSLNIAVTVANHGTFTETVTVSVFVDNGTNVAPAQNTTLTSGTNTILTFIWNATGWALGDYNITASAPLGGDATPADNTLNYGIIHVTPPGLLGDVNGDGHVDMKDIALCVQAFNSFTGGPRYNSPADVDGSGRIDLHDLVIIIINYKP
jgi:hypothetical protein